MFKRFINFLAVLWGILSSLAWASDFPGHLSNPARFAAPGFELSYSQGGYLQKTGAEGEWGGDFFRLSFGSSYVQMDSIYRQVYSEISTSVYNDWLVVGGGYGLSTEWIPGEQNWGRHRYKSGVMLLWKGLAMSAMASLWGDDPGATFEYRVGFQAKAGSRIRASLEWDGHFLEVVNQVRFKYVEIESAYRFPDFGVAVSVAFFFENWSVSGNYGFMGQIWDWFGFAISRKVPKKSIL